jgi:radical SAM superfamily enzyme YgiQ (UPF0313 family)
MQTKRLLLVSPDDFATTYGDLRHISHITGDVGRLLNVALPTLAALTPDEFDVTIVDENVEPIDFSQRYDVVGITGFPPQIYRAREIAARFRAEGALVVCGGTSVSLSPERWRDVADVLVIGEAERTWPRLCEDLLDGRVAPEYRELERPDLALAPLPDYSRYSRAALSRFSGGIVQTSRGCPFECEFCDAIVFAGRTMRYKPVDAILAEVEQLGALGMRHIYLADDNFGAHRRKAKEILVALRDWNRRRARPMPFLTQLTIDVADDEELLELAAEAGLFRVFVGLETPNLESLVETGKKQNVRTDMREGVRRFQEHGIEVLGGSVVGFDHDDLTIFQRQLDFFSEIGVPSVQVYPLNAPDATPLKERMIREGRYIDWAKSQSAGTKHFSYFNSYTVVPAQMSVEQLQKGVYWLLWKLYEPRRVAARLRVFLERYEASPKRRALAGRATGDASLAATLTRVLRHDRDVLSLLYRILRYLAREGSRDEAVAFAELLDAARRSSHPQRWSLAVGAFLQMVNTRRMLLEQAPGIETTPYPVETDPDAAARRVAPPDVDVARVLRSRKKRRASGA